VYVCICTEYLVLLRASASNAAAPAEIVVFRKCDGAKVSGHVKSQRRGRPFIHGICVTPSGLLQSPLINPGGSIIDGTPIRRNVRAMMSFAAW